MLILTGKLSRTPSTCRLQPVPTVSEKPRLSGGWTDLGTATSLSPGDQAWRPGTWQHSGLGTLLSQDGAPTRWPAGRVVSCLRTVCPGVTQVRSGMANSPQYTELHARCFRETRTRGTGPCSRKAQNVLGSLSMWQLGGNGKQVRFEATAVTAPGAQGLASGPGNSAWSPFSWSPTEVGAG